MRILHILSKDATVTQQQQFLRFLAILDSVSDTHRTLTFPFKDIEKELSSKGATFDTQKFGGMFDLRTKKALQDIMNNFTPHIIVSHSEESAAFTSTHIKSTPHIGIIDGGSADRHIASFCDHTVMVTEKHEDAEILKTALSRFETVLKRHEEKT